jgi:ABC-2 type transport system ATP-binding protein
VHDPPVLVLDEPTAGLDPRQVAETRELIARLARRRTVLLSTHLLGEVTQLCRRVAVLDRGRLVAFDDIASLTSVGMHSRLEVRINGDTELAVATVRALPDVLAVQDQSGALVVTGHGADLGERVSTALVHAGIGVAELRATRTGTLEEAYLKLVGE